MSSLSTAILELPSQSIDIAAVKPPQLNDHHSKDHAEKTEIDFDWPIYAIFPSWTWATWEGQVKYEVRIL